MRAIHPHSPHGFTDKPLTRTKFSYLPYHLAAGREDSRFKFVYTCIPHFNFEKAY